MRAKRLTDLVWTVAGALLLSGCTSGGLYGMQVPGGAADDGHAYQVAVEFRDVLDLVPQSAVKVNDVTVGAVEKVELDGWQAKVWLRVADSVKLPANAVADLKQTSVLGEKYVELAAPTDTKPVGRLKDGALIPLSRSGRDPEIEEVLSALAALLNGGGVAQLKTISVELNKALNGRESQARDLLKQLNTFIGGLDAQRADIVRALTGIDRLASRLAKEKQTIARALDTIPPALKVLADERRKLTTMLTSLAKLGRTGTAVINASRDDMVANLRSLRPILEELNQAGNDLPNALEILTTYPFPRNATDAVKGDYVNLRITADLDLSSIYSNLTSGSGSGGGSGPGSGGTKLPTLPGGPSLPTPSPLPSLPGLPLTPGAPSASPTTSGGGSGAGGGGLLCPPVCTSAYTTRTSGAGDGRRFPPGVDLALAELMLKGMQP
jgi:phospholipid/cholesterol/gamma-HCH transport system substrate-binding protein